MNKQDNMHEITLERLLPVCAPLREPTKLVQILLYFCYSFNFIKNLELHNKVIQTTWFKPRAPVFHCSTLF